MDQIAVHRKQIHKHILSKVFHPYLRRFFNEPEIDDNRILIFILLLKDLELTEHDRNQLITAAMLVQIALDIHEGVLESAPDEEDDTAHKVRQLSVLAGDYYSGLYYYSLSMLENIDAIRSLAKGIKEINEQKVILYKNDFTNEYEVLKSVEKIESSLMTNIAESLCVNKFIPFIQSYFLLQRLQVETEKIKRNASSQVYDAFSNIHFMKRQRDLSFDERKELIGIVTNHIETIHASCLNAYKVLSNGDASILSTLNHLFFKEEFIFNSNVEEG